MNTLSIRLKMPEQEALTCRDAVNMEAHSQSLSRSSVNLYYSRSSGELVVDIKAEDLTALRAALNTYLRWVLMCSEVISIK